jgi:hypothetical protein
LLKTKEIQYFRNELNAASIAVHKTKWTFAEHSDIREQAHLKMKAHSFSAFCFVKK